MATSLAAIGLIATVGASPTAYYGEARPTSRRQLVGIPGALGAVAEAPRSSSGSPRGRMLSISDSQRSWPPLE